MDIIKLIDRWGKQAADHPAHISGGRVLTYGELCRRSDALAAHLGRVLPEKSPIVVLGHKEPEILIAFLGAVKSGRAYIPVDTVVPPQRVERIVATSESRLVLTPTEIAALSEGAEAAPPCPLGVDDPFYIMFT